MFAVTPAFTGENGNRVGRSSARIVGQIRDRIARDKGRREAVRGVEKHTNRIVGRLRSRNGLAEVVVRSADRGRLLRSRVSVDR